MNRVMRPMVVEAGKSFVSAEVEAGILMRGGHANCNLVASSEREQTKDEIIQDCP